MIICDRCKKNDAKYKTYVGDRYVALCDSCHKDCEEMMNVFIGIEKTFMKNKTLKHIDVNWE